MKIVNLPQRSPEWLEWRKGGVSASEAAVILGLSPYQTPWRLWAEKRGLAIPEDLSRNPFVKHGIEFEDVARREFEKRHPGEFALPMCAESEVVPIMRASFDGVISQNRPAELKCPCRSVFDEIVLLGRQSKAYQLYWPQVQHQMYVSGASEGYLFFWYQGEEPQEFLIQRDDAFLDKLVSKAKEFADRVVKGKAPDKDPKRDVYIPRGQKAKSWISVADRMKELHAKMQPLKEQLKKFDQERKKIEAELRAVLGDHYTGEYAGVRMSRYYRAGKVNYEAFLKDHVPELDLSMLEAYREDSIEQTRISVTGTDLPDWNADEDLLAEFMKLNEEESEALFF